MNLNKRKEYFEEKLQKWHERIYALKVKGDINGDVSQKLEYLISLMLAKALPEYIPFEIEPVNLLEWLQRLRRAVSSCISWMERKNELSAL